MNLKALPHFSKMTPGNCFWGHLLRMNLKRSHIFVLSPKKAKYSLGGGGGGGGGGASQQQQQPTSAAPPHASILRNQLVIDENVQQHCCLEDNWNEFLMMRMKDTIDTKVITNKDNNLGNKTITTLQQRQNKD